MHHRGWSDPNKIITQIGVTPPNSSQNIEAPHKMHHKEWSDPTTSTPNHQLPPTTAPPRPAKFITRSAVGVRWVVVRKKGAK